MRLHRWILRSIGEQCKHVALIIWSECAEWLVWGVHLCKLFPHFADAVSTVSPILNSALRMPPFWSSFANMNCPQFLSVLLSFDLVVLNPHWCSSALMFADFSFCPAPIPSVYFSSAHPTPRLVFLYSWWLLPFFISIIIAFQMPIYIHR